MHEASIADHLLSLVAGEAAERGADRVTAIDVEVGAFELVVPEMLATAFEFASHGTVAEGAELRLTEAAPLAVCRACDHEYVPEIANYACPVCGQADAELVSGRGIILKSFELELE